MFCLRCTVDFGIGLGWVGLGLGWVGLDLLGWFAFILFCFCFAAVAVVGVSPFCLDFNLMSAPLARATPPILPARPCCLWLSSFGLERARLRTPFANLELICNRVEGNRG